VKPLQKLVRVTKGSDMWLLGPSGGDGYLASQCKGNSGLEKDLSQGWYVKHCWEDSYQIVFLLEKP